MTVRYDGQETDATDLELSDTPDASQSLMGVRSTLLQWHLDDPVSAEEITRNHLVCSNYQGNRNPFVDHPSWVNCAILGSVALLCRPHHQWRHHLLSSPPLAACSSPA